MHRPFHRWSHQSHKTERHMVFPDGCRDVLIAQKTDGPIEVTLTNFDFTPRMVMTHSGVQMTGYRLRPGAVVFPKTLEAITRNPCQAEAILTSTFGAWNDLDDTIMALTAPDASVQTVARHAGVSIRTLQRQFLAQHLPAPDFWRLLARARRAAGMLVRSEPLAEIASACGFSDQAHMSRDLLRWFGCSPAQLRRNASVLDLLRQPALGNWTGEQISTR